MSLLLRLKNMWAKTSDNKTEYFSVQLENVLLKFPPKKLSIKKIGLERKKIIPNVSFNIGGGTLKYFFKFFDSQNMNKICIVNLFHLRSCHLKSKFYKLARMNNTSFFQAIQYQYNTRAPVSQYNTNVIPMKY